MEEGLSDTSLPNHKDKLDTLVSCKGGYQHMTFQLRGRLSLGSWLCLGVPKGSVTVLFSFDSQPTCHRHFIHDPRMGVPLECSLTSPRVDEGDQKDSSIVTLGTISQGFPTASQ